METKDIITWFSSIHIGTIVAWCCFIAGIITAISTGTIKLYKIFEKTHDIKEDNDEFRRMVKDHDEQLKSINDKLTSIHKNLDKRDELDLKKLRYSIVRAGEEYVSNEAITIRQLKALEEMFEEYHDKHGNGYCATLMRKVRALPVIGKLDENDNDLE